MGQKRTPGASGGNGERATKRTVERGGGALLRTLRVRNFAIVDDVEVSFESGLNVITGETGAGKTLILRALAVALGGRVDEGVVRAGASEAVIEAVFECSVPEVEKLLEDGGYETDAEVVIRRVVAAGGRTRSYLNGSVASVGVLTSLAPHFVRVYGQHEHEALRRVESHGELLDGVASFGLTVAEMSRRHAALVGARRALGDLEERRQSAGTHAELLRLQLDELKRAAVVKGEMATLAADRTRHKGAARLLTLSRGVESALYSNEGAAVELVGRAIGQLREMEAIDQEVRETRAVLEGALAQLEEAGVWVGRYASRVESDPEQQAAIEERLAEISRLARKYDRPADALPDLAVRIEEELGGVDVSDTALTKARQTCEATERAAVQWAGKLSVERRRAAKDLERRMDEQLGTLGMDGAHFTVQFADPGVDGRVVGSRGWDDLEFYLAPNEGEPARPLARVASGGELSRIILALKTLGAAGTPGATLIFDEVDAGIGGAVAEVVGRKLKTLAGGGGQVICVTHLPQIAAFADHHYGVSKRTTDGRTTAMVRQLRRDDQVGEIARMLGGASMRRETREHAQQMLRAAAQQPAQRA
jgi:DNA repair protein RecN (Recombination protein N)